MPSQQEVVCLAEQVLHKHQRQLQVDYLVLKLKLQSQQPEACLVKQPNLLMLQRQLEDYLGEQVNQ
jgi:hypothetical protein